MRILSEKYGLPWETMPLETLLALGFCITKKSGVSCDCEAVEYRGQGATVLTFTKDDDRRRLERNKFSEEQMDRLRETIGLPEGTKPKWFEVYGREYEQLDQDESGDEDYPRIKIRR